MQNNWFGWQDELVSKSFEVKVREAAYAFRSQYGEWPTVVCVHLSHSQGTYKGLSVTTIGPTISNPNILYLQRDPDQATGETPELKAHPSTDKPEKKTGKKATKKAAKKAPEVEIELANGNTITDQPVQQRLRGFNVPPAQTQTRRFTPQRRA